MDKTKEKTVVRELDEMRTRNRNAFEMSDGTKQMVFYPKAVNAFDEETKGYKGVDNTLAVEEDGKHYTNHKGRFTARFSNEDTNDELFTIEDGIYSVSVAAMRNHRAASKRGMPKHTKLNTTKDPKDTLVFDNIDDGVDYEYSVDGNGVKENIIVKKKADSYRYSFELTCKNVSAVYDEKRKRVIFCEPENNTEVFNIPAPFMTDASGALSTAVEYEIKPMKNGKIEFTVAADESWINADNRVFPVTIDPQITCNKKNAFDSFIYMDGELTDGGVIHPVGISDEDGELLTNRMYIALDNIDIPSNIKVKKAELTLVQWMYEITDTANLPIIGIFDASGEAIADGDVISSEVGHAIDYEEIKRENTTSSKIVSYTFDITHFLEGAANNNFEGSTLAVKLLDESYTDNNYVIIYGCSGTKNYPAITVTYETDYAVDSSAPVHTHALGRFGTGMIDLKYGNLMLEGEDFAWSGNKMPVTIKHLYNGALAGYQYTDNPDIDLHIADFGAMNVGLGWRLNLMQSVKYVELLDENEEAYDAYVYVNEIGAKTYFVGSGSNYEDADGNGMSYNPYTGTLVSGNETYIFDIDGRLTEIRSTYNEDDNLYHAMSIVYDTSGKISTVTDGAGRIFRFTYDATTGDLLSITAPDNTVVSYTYTDGVLETITYPDATKTVFTTSATDQITRVDIRNSDNDVLYRVSYGYTGGNVTSVDERGTRFVGGTATYESGAHTEYEYSIAAKQTIVSTTEAADAESGETSDNIVKTIYTFDSDDNILSRCIYTDDTGHIGIDGEVGGIHPHGADGGADLAANVVNLLDETNPVDWSTISSSASGVTFSEGTKENRAVFGTTYLNIESSIESNVGFGKYLNVGSLPAGDYTFSAYVNLGVHGIVGDNAPGIYLRVSDTSGNPIAYSECLNKNDDTHVRLAASFTLTSAKSVKVEIVMNGKGSVDVNAPQLENNAYAGPYTMIKNGSFENGFTDWLQYDGTDNDTTNTTDDFSAGHAGRLVGNLERAKNLCQVVYPKTADSTRETFTLSGWAKGESVVQRTRTNFNDAKFRLRAVVVYAGETETTEEYSVDFAPYVTDWQFASIQFAKKDFCAVEAIMVYCDYDYNLGTATFDNIALVRDSIEEGLKKEDFTFEEEVVDSTVVESEDETDNAYDDFEEVYDEYGNPLTETKFTFGEFGTIYRSFEYSGGTAENSELAGNDLIVERDARNKPTSYDVDPNTSRVNKVTDREGNITAYEYDNTGRTTKVTSKNAAETTLASVDYTYDAFDNLTSIQRGDGMDYALGYNAFHKLESIGVVGRTNPLATYTYKACNGRLKKITYANGDYMTATYNSIGQLVTEKWYDANNTLTAHYKYSYDHNGNIIRSIDILLNKEYNYIYEDGRIVRATQSTITVSGESITSKTLDLMICYIYDENGRLTKKYTSEDDLMNVGGTFYEYDENGGTVVLYSDRYDYTGDNGDDYEGKLIISHSHNDTFGRKEFDEIKLGSGFVSRKFSYLAGEVHAAHTENDQLMFTPTTNLVSEIVMSDGHVLSYTYDAEERITSVTDTDTNVDPATSTVTSYTYDALGQLLTETCDGVTVNTMSYDNYGNITSKNGISYTYDATWKDLLTSYNGQAITYDAQGNPTTYLGHTLTWEKGRQLKSFDTNTYTYNANGIRTSKTVGGVVHNYLLDGAKILRETWGDNTLVTLWDNEDSICGIKYNGASYYFLKNLQGDIIAITDNNGAVIARYSYDAWGVCTIDNPTSADIATVNPFRYRGYYYDAEIGMYYLQSRYYDPVVARFVNADEALIFTSISSYITDSNAFSYAKNSGPNYTDKAGFFAMEATISAIAGTMLSAILELILVIVTAVVCALVIVGVMAIAIKLFESYEKAATQIMSVVNSNVESGKYDKNKNKKGYVVYVLTKNKNAPNDIFYVGRTSNYSKRFQAHKLKKLSFVGNFYGYIVYICDSAIQSRLVEQAVLSACIFSKLFDLDKGPIPNGSNRIRGIAINKLNDFVGDMDELRSLLTCTADSDLLSLMGM